ncbi:MAG: DUF2189 domain-containing protein [Acetobacteraceae bacterium]
MTIRNPVVWSWDQLKDATVAVANAGQAEPDTHHGALPRVRLIGIADIGNALARGYDDFRADPTHCVFLCGIYPIIGLILARIAMGYNILPLIFPLIAGFALVGPFAAVGLYELSRRRERGEEIAWWHAFAVFRSPAIGGILRLGMALTVLFVLWLLVAEKLYEALFGTHVAGTALGFLHEILTTRNGWILIVVGNFLGFLFALAALVLSAVSFPLILDRNMRPESAVLVSVRAVAANPLPMTVWGIIVAAGLVIGSLPFLLGLAFVLPILGHATWHLYRCVVEPPPA